MEKVRAWLEFFDEMGAGFTIAPVKESGLENRGELDCIVREIGQCRACPLAESKTHYVPGEGAPKPDVMFIGEGPGETEDRFGRPFIGNAGQLLTKIIEKMGYQRSEVYISNVVKCRPPQNREPSPDEVAACKPFLLRQIEALDPKVIVCLGRVAFGHLLGSDEGITRVRGKVFYFADRPVVPTFHPSYILHQKEKEAISKAKWQVWEDMQTVLKLLGKKP